MSTGRKTPKASRLMSLRVGYRSTDDCALPSTHATSIKVGRTEYPALWVGTPNVIAYVFVPAKEDGHVFLVWLDLSLSDEENTKEQNMQRVGWWLRPLVRSLENASGNSVRPSEPTSRAAGRPARDLPGASTHAELGRCGG